MAYIFQPERFLLRSHIKENASYISGRILDVGAGPLDRYGQFFNAEEYVRLDPKEHESIDVKGRAEKLPFPQEIFNGIVCTQVFGDVYELKKAVSEFKRVLKPGGRVLLTEALISPIHDAPQDFWRFTPYSLRKLFKDAGFTVLKIVSIGGFFSVKAQMNTRYLIERFDVYNRWYVRVFSFLAKMYGKFTMVLDAIDNTPANKKYSHGFLIVVEK